MKYLLALASIIVVIILPLACGGTSTDTSSEPTNASWHHVVTFSGTGSKTTPSFYIPGDKFRLTWTIDVEADASQYGIGGSFGVFVYPQYETAWYVDYFDAGNVMYFDTDINYVYEGKGNYYLKVIAANLDSWEIEVESYHVSAATPPDTTPTPSDTTPPVISAVSTSITTTTATITWTTNEPATTRVEYGLTTSCGSATSLDAALVTSHSAVLTSLLPSTTYYFTVVSKDDDGNESKSFNYFETKTQFQLTTHAVIDDGGAASLSVQFTASDSVSLSLTNPQGTEVGTDFCSQGETQAMLRMADLWKVPNPGKYTLIVETVLGEHIATHDFEFSGANVTISDLSLTWQFWEYLDDYSLNSVSFKATNSGDLPVYISEIRLFISGISDMIVLYPVVAVLPGQQQSVYHSTFVSDIPPGTHTLTLQPVDSAGTVICTYTCSVTPA